ncbi:MAG: sigma-70 family RNA polymerase sigma factor, partial [bacterium]|nr:sigma-70 family RNA polymerase sigma factor [bacterium]
MHEPPLTDPSLKDIVARGEWLRDLARRLVADAVSAEDIAQDATLAALRYRGVVDVPDAWWRGVVRNLVANTKRQATRRERLERQRAVPEAQASAAQSVERVEQETQLAKVVLGLDQPFRDVVILRFYDGLERREIAAQLGVPIATVNSRLTRAMAKLRERLAEEHGEGRQWILAITPLVDRGFALEWWTVRAVLLGRAGGFAVAMLLLCAVMAWTFWPAWTAAPTHDSQGPVAFEQLDHEGPTSVIERVAVDPNPDASLFVPDVDTTKAFAQVVHGDTGKPVPQAIVRRLDGANRDLSNSKVSMRILPGDGDGIEWMFAEGPIVALDRLARFHLPEGRKPSSWTATHKDRRGVLRFSPRRSKGETPVRLELTEKQVVQVRVTDAGGVPVDRVPVGIYNSLHGQSQRMSQPVLTNREGKAALAWLPSMSSNAQTSFAVGFTFPGAGHERRPIQADTPGSTVELTLPATGVVAVHMTVDGAPAEDGTPVTLGGTGAHLMTRSVRCCRGGVAVFERVGMGRSFVPIFGATREQAVVGPVSAGERVQAELHLETYVLRGRVHGRDGQAMRRTPASIEWSGGRIWFRFQTDADGRFEVKASVLAGTILDGESAAVMLFPSKERLQLDLPGAEGRRFDLGDLRFGTDQTVVRGIVRDPDSRPVVGVPVEFVRPDPGSRTGWRSIGVDVATDAEGQFVMPRREAEELWIRVKPMDRLRHEPQRVGSGALELTMVPAATLKGRLETGGASTHGMNVHLWDEATGPAPRTALQTARSKWLPAAIDSSGAFEFKGLPGGRYSLAVSMRHGSELTRIPAIEVSAGAVHSPESLRPWDLRPLTHTLRVDARDEGGRPVPGRITRFGDGLGSRLQLATHVTHLVERRPLTTSIMVEADGCFRKYSGKKEALKPIYDTLIKAIKKLGKDVEIAPKKAYVSLRRNKQFALIQPSTATRVDVGLCLKGIEATDRL